MSDASSDEAGGGGGGGFPASAATAAASGREGVLPLSLGGLAPSDRAVSAGEEESDNGMQATDDFADAADGSSFPASAATTTAAATTGGELPLSLGGLAPNPIMARKRPTAFPHPPPPPPRVCCRNFITSAGARALQSLWGCAA
jgi:hypothetical protein